MPRPPASSARAPAYSAFPREGASSGDEEEGEKVEALFRDREPAAPPEARALAAKAAGACAGVLLLTAVAAWAGSGHGLAGSSAAGDSTAFASVATGQRNWSVSVRERDLCSGAGENCMATGCCKVSGQRCIKESPQLAKCARYCPTGKTCTVITQSLTFDAREHSSLFCFTVYTQNTGSHKKKSHEKELLSEQYAKKVSLFACDAYAVYSDVAVSLGEGLTTNKVVDVDHDFHFAKRKITGTWINTGMFSQVWKAIGKAGTYSSYDWTVKVDPDAVFFPGKLRQRIHLLPVPPSGAFLQNCQGVDYGFFGNLEVMSKTAFSILIANVDTCKFQTVAIWKVGVDGGKYGPMGEDLFAQICMQKNGVAMVDAFDISTDGACESKRPLDQRKNKKWRPNCAQTYTPAIHPFKEPADYFKCMEAAMPLE